MPHLRLPTFIHPPIARRAREVVSLVLAGAAGLFAAAPAAAETVRIAASRSPLSLPLYVALERGFFRDEGLEVAISDCVGGQRCLRALLDGQADLATSSEMPVVLHAFQATDVAIVATMTNSSDNIKLVARKASGVTRSEQLDGRRIGVMPGTASQYVLETHLLAFGVDPQRVTMVPLEADGIAQALASGRIDAVAVWEPFGYQALHAAAGQEPVGIRLPPTGAYSETFDLVVGRVLLGARDETLVHLLRAVDRAAQFVQAHPADAQDVLMHRLGLDQRFVDWVWGGLTFRLSLEQSLLTTMEAEARWAQREGHVAGGARPNVLTLIHPGPLKLIKPSAVGTGN